MQKHIHLVLFFALSLAVPVAACGGGAGPSGDPQTPTSPTAPADVGSAPTGTELAEGPTGTSTTGVPPTSGPTGKMKAITASEMGPALKDLGLDVKNLPPMNKIPPDKIRKVMGTFTKALGMKCTGCHDGDDFKKPTPHKKIAARMWNEMVRGYALEGGGAVYCDSCHQGKAEFLVRDPGLKELSTWMDENFVAQMKKTNGQEVACETCHGDPMEGKFLHSWAK
jgi:hypothetical protein